MSYFHQQLLELIQQDKRIVWATVIRSEGSTPQKAGISAIFGLDGLIAGTVGGGIMEADTTDLARKLLGKRTSNIFHFDLDSTPEKDGAICGGKADMLLDADPSLHREALESLVSALHQRKEGRLLTLVGKENEHGRKIKRYWIEGNDPELVPDHEASAFELSFLEHIYPLPRLFIAGAGHIGKAVSHLGKLLDFEVTVVDDRPEFANMKNLPDADHVVVEDIGHFMQGVRPDKDTYCVIVTRGHVEDGEALKPLIGSEAAYVGMMGSRHKVATMKKQFLKEGWATGEQWDALHTPIGIPIGSKTVQEIAVSIVSQLIKVRNDKSEKHGE
jgi:xanthine dehydrogenase accessory factor